MNDRTSIPKVVTTGDIVYDKAQTGKYFRVIETFEKVVFNVKKNIARLSNGRTFVNSNIGIDTCGFNKWIPESEKFVVINSSDNNEYLIKRIKNVNIIKKQVLCYDNSILKFSEISPFIGEII